MMTVYSERKTLKPNLRRKKSTKEKEKKKNK